MNGLTICSWAVPRHILVQSGNAQSLLDAISSANEQNADSAAERLIIFVPNGFYDLGERTLTAITGHNISIVGESIDGTIIRNAPPIEVESINKTATLVNHGINFHLQDLTLKNDLDYYHSGAAGRAVCLQDKGTHTICLRVRMLSYQDTYYSYDDMAQLYLDHCEIHGTVDFICGTGDVYFNHCNIFTEKRKLDGSGRCVIAAPRTANTPWGYVFESCIIQSDTSPFTFARGWHTKPHCTFLNTKLMQPELLEEQRFDPFTIRSVDCILHEYGTIDANGKNITPESNRITIVHDNDSNTIETILSARDAKHITLRTVFPDWKPDKQVRRLEKQVAKLKRYLL